MAEIILRRTVGIYISPQRQNIFNSRRSQLIKDIINILFSIVNACKMSYRHNIVFIFYYRAYFAG